MGILEWNGKDFLFDRKCSERRERMRIEELRTALDNGFPVEYSLHCQKRMLERGISRDDIKHCIYNGEIIEN